MIRELRYDEIGYWSEVKHDIIKEYASAYSRILSTQSTKFYHLYIDAFAGAGKHRLKGSGDFVPGSPLNALNVHPPFCEYHFIELEEQKVESLKNLIGSRENVHIHHGDCNEILIKKVLPLVQYREYRRALCVLDPYGLHLDWEVIYEIGQMKSIEIFLNFQVVDANRNVLWRKPEMVSNSQVERMNRFWGDASWRQEAYAKKAQKHIFKESEEEKQPTAVIADAFRKRLKNVAGFANVPAPMAMRNSRNAIIYYLFFASHKPVAEHIVKDIFRKHENR
jgi:three-Cys-motif partner protein